MKQHNEPVVVIPGVASRIGEALVIKLANKVYQTHGWFKNTTEVNRG